MMLALNNLQNGYEDLMGITQQIDEWRQEYYSQSNSSNNWKYSWPDNSWANNSSN